MQGIYEYSEERWGRSAAKKYIGELDSGLQRPQEHPQLLRSEPDFHAALKFYRVNKHVFVCDVQERSIVVLTVAHASMDLPSRLAELQPTLADEVQILHERLAQK
jgi:plasmid stabilization system protein ParE